MTDEQNNKDQQQPGITNEQPSLDPFEINFLPQFEEGRGPREAFVNEHGVVIGDHMYESANSPLTNWTSETDPAIMAGDQWVHPFKDIGFQSAENREYFEHGILPSATGAMFTHPDKDVAYQAGPADTQPQDNGAAQDVADGGDWS
ncbi:DUF3905 domain-containing protein [Paenibacillus koleovorans]|uniref:DUF3905 domain-containing protein n=1 Tax=Paenibacillus koleovorans TaxID=121608 RepID=UPI000FDB5373|nr:DUF3905 domain-containing protein [Paenibacillus koleovorans]